MNSRMKGLLPALAMYGAPLFRSEGVHVKPVEKLQMKGLSSEEMGTKGNGKKLSKAQRKKKNIKRKK